MIVATFLWAVVSLAVGFGSAQLQPIYRDFEIELPTFTKWLLQRTTLWMLVAITLSIPIVWCLLRTDRLRNLFSGVSIVAVIVFCFISLYSFFVPLVASIRSMTA